MLGDSNEYPQHNVFMEKNKQNYPIITGITKYPLHLFREGLDARSSEQGLSQAFVPSLVKVPQIPRESLDMTLIVLAVALNFDQPDSKIIKIIKGSC